MVSFSHVLVDVAKVHGTVDEAADYINTTITEWGSQPAATPSAEKLLVLTYRFYPEGVMHRVDRVLPEHTKRTAVIECGDRLEFLQGMTTSSCDG